MYIIINFTQSQLCSMHMQFTEYFLLQVYHLDCGHFVLKIVFLLFFTLKMLPHCAVEPCMLKLLPVCCSSFAWPAPGCPVPDPAQEGYCWPGGASGWGKAETVMGGHHLTEHRPGPG